VPCTQTQVVYVGHIQTLAKVMQISGKTNMRKVEWPLYKKTHWKIFKTFNPELGTK